MHFLKLLSIWSSFEIFKKASRQPSHRCRNIYSKCCCFGLWKNTHTCPLSHHSPNTFSPSFFPFHWHRSLQKILSHAACGLNGILPVQIFSFGVPCAVLLHWVPVLGWSLGLSAEKQIRKQCYEIASLSNFLLFISSRLFNVLYIFFITGKHKSPIFYVIIHCSSNEAVAEDRLTGHFFMILWALHDRWKGKIKLVHM